MSPHPPEVASDDAPADPIAVAPKKRRLAALAGIALVALIFLASAVAKLSTIGGFEIQLVQQGLFESRAAAAWPARILTALELWIAIGMLQPFLRRRLFCGMAAAMLIAFSGWLAWSLLGGTATEDCGCFGDLLKMSPELALARNLAMLAILGAAWRFVPERSGAIAPLAVAAAAIAVTVIAAPVRPPLQPQPATDASVENVPKKPSPFAAFSGFSDGTASLVSGTRIVAFLSLDCEHCQAVAGQLAGNADALPPIHVLYLGGADNVPEFEGMSGSAFPWAIPDPGRFFDFIGEAPPRIYLLRDGRPLHHWDEADFSVDALRAAVDALPTATKHDPASPQIDHSIIE